MTPFEYLSVVVSVVIGLGLSQLLSGVVGLIQERDRVRIDWLYLVWVGLTFLGLLFLWWSFWGLRDLRVWNFFWFVALILEPVILFAAAAFLIPHRIPEDGLDLRDYVLKSRRGIFGSYALFAVVLASQNIARSSFHIHPATALIAALVVPLLIAAWTPNRRYHVGLALVSILWLLAFIIRFGLTLQAR